ncbi:hypothetical protein D3C80_2026680 [compost metagenome]
MVEKVEKAPQTRLLPGVFPCQFVQVVAGHRRLAAVQPEKRHFKTAHPAVFLTEADDIAGMKAQRRGGCKTHPLPLRMNIQVRFRIDVLKLME